MHTYIAVVLKQNFIAYRSSKVSWRPDCIFEIHQLWQSGLSRVYSNCCCSCSFEPEIIKICQSSHKMYSNNILNFLVYDNFKCLYKKFWKLIEGTMYMICNTFCLYYFSKSLNSFFWTQLNGFKSCFVIIGHSLGEGVYSFVEVGASVGVILSKLDYMSEFKSH